MTGLAKKLLGVWMRLTAALPSRPRPEDFRRELWPDSTKRMGVRLSERIRDHFRRLWFKVR